MKNQVYNTEQLYFFRREIPIANFHCHLQALKRTLAPMSWKARLDHLWTYYKWVPITLLGMILLASSIIPSTLESLLMPQQLEQLQERLLYRETAEGVTLPFAIDLSNTAFASACGLEEDGLFVAFPGNTDRTQYIGDFVDYLLNWK